MVEQTIAAGFNNIEGPIPRDESEQRKLRQCLSDGNLLFIAEATTGTDPGSVAKNGVVLQKPRR